MANVYIKTVDGGEDTTPTGTDAIELDDGTTSRWTLLSNLYKAMGSGTQDSTTFLRGDGTYAAPGTSRNAIINGTFAIAQRGTSFTSATSPANSDDTYLLDRWILLSDGNDIVDVSQETSATIADPAYNIKLDVETANKKFGILTILEQKDARRLINQTVSLSFKAKITGTTIGAIRAAILSWSSTADTVTSDIVSAWEAAVTNPTLVANWNYENTPAALTAPTTSWQTYEIEGITIDTASAANVAVFIWTDDTTMDVGDFLHIAEVQLELGSVATPFEFRHYQQELALCQRYYERLVAGATMIANLFADTTSVAYGETFWVPKRVAPTFAVGTLANWSIRYKAGGLSVCTALSMLYSNISMGLISATATGTPLTAGEAMLLKATAAGEWLELSAEL